MARRYTKPPALPCWPTGKSKLDLCAVGQLLEILDAEHHRKANAHDSQSNGEHRGNHPCHIRSDRGQASAHNVRNGSGARAFSNCDKRINTVHFDSFLVAPLLGEVK